MVFERGCATHPLPPQSPTPPALPVLLFVSSCSFFPVCARWNSETGKGSFHEDLAGFVQR